MSKYTDMLADKYRLEVLSDYVLDREVKIKMVCMTEKQREFIKDICDVLKIDFDDCKNFSKMEASKFISDNIKEYTLVCKEMFDAYNSWALEHGYD